MLHGPAAGRIGSMANHPLAELCPFCARLLIAHTEDGKLVFSRERGLIIDCAELYGGCGWRFVPPPSESIEAVSGNWEALYRWLRDIRDGYRRDLLDTSPIYLPPRP